MSEMPWPPRPMELGKQTCAWIPESFMTSMRAGMSKAPRWMSSCVHSKSASAARPFPPWRSMTPPPPAKPSSAPSTYHMGFPSTLTTCGTRSAYLAGARLVHRSCASVRCVSASMTRRPSSARAICCSSPQSADGQPYGLDYGHAHPGDRGPTAPEPNRCPRNRVRGGDALPHRGRLPGQLGQLLGDHAVVLVEIAPGRPRAPPAPHEEDQHREHELAGQTHPPPALPLARRGLLRRDELLLGHQETGQVARILGYPCDLGRGHRLAVLNVPGERIER